MTIPFQCRPVLYLGCFLAFSFATDSRARTSVAVGSKVFTESVILGEIITQFGESAGVETVHRSQLGGTRILWDALLAGQIDAYPEYTGTIVHELLPGVPGDIERLRQVLAKRGIGVTQSLGFSDTYALGMPEVLADRLKIKTISDLRGQPQLRFAFSNEFISRADGWPAVKAGYGLDPASVTGLEHELAYRAVSSHSVDVIDLYTTDPEILSYHLRVLEDNRHVFPPYEAVILYRLDLKERSPKFLEVIHRLEGAIDVSTMTKMNADCKLRKIPESGVAAQFLFTHFGIKREGQEQSLWGEFLLRTREHLLLVSISLIASILVAVPLGMFAFVWPKLGYLILGLVAVVYTIPALALLVLMIPLLGIGTVPAIVALFLYGLLPIVRNTHAGLVSIPSGIRESAIVLGLPLWARILKIELPLASPAILAGIKTTAVINVGTATLGALIGAGGYGQPILTGIRLADTHLILLGALPSAGLALLVQGAFGVLERVALPRGLRLRVRS